MKLKHAVMVSGLALFALVPVLLADASSRAAILREREAVLSKIVAELEGRQSAGLSDEEAIFLAKVELLSFQRDQAPSTEAKITAQGKIVALLEKRLERRKAAYQAGTSTSLEILRATDALLAAKQLLEEIRLGAREH